MEHQPLFSYLQETHLLPEHRLHIRGYVCYRKDTDDGLRAHGGVAILAHDSIHLQEIGLQSTLPVVAVKVTMSHLSFQLCSSYLPPGQPLSATDLFDLFSKLQTPFIVIGDFNAHNFIMGSSQTCQRGALLEQVLFAHNLFLLNTGEPTHIFMVLLLP